MTAIFAMRSRPHSHFYIFMSSGWSILNLSSTGLVATKNDMFKYINGSPTYATLAERSKVNFDLRLLSIVTVLLDLPSLVSIMTSVSMVIENLTFQDYSY